MWRYQVFARTVTRYLFPSCLWVLTIWQKTPKIIKVKIKWYSNFPEIPLGHFERNGNGERKDERYPSFRNGKSKTCVPFRAFQFLPLPVSSACARKLIALRITAALCRCSFCGKKSPTLETLLLKRAKVKLIVGNIIVRCIFLPGLSKKKTCKQINLFASRLGPFAPKPFRTKIFILQSSDSLSTPFEMIAHIP